MQRRALLAAVGRGLRVLRRNGKRHHADLLITDAALFPAVRFKNAFAHERLQCPRRAGVFKNSFEICQRAASVMGKHRVEHKLLLRRFSRRGIRSLPVESGGERIHRLQLIPEPSGQHGVHSIVDRAEISFPQPDRQPDHLRGEHGR